MDPHHLVHGIKIPAFLCPTSVALSSNRDSGRLSKSLHFSVWGIRVRNAPSHDRKKKAESFPPSQLILRTIGLREDRLGRTVSQQEE